MDDRRPRGLVTVLIMPISDRTYRRALRDLGRRCANRRCRETLGPLVRLRLCPSCRTAGRWGAALAGVLWGLVKLAGWYVAR
jgi:hypothetical protein